ncbi:hypothetical protein QQG55_28550 [Brugia pahangi]
MLSFKFQINNVDITCINKMECPSMFITVLLFGIVAIQWSKVASFSTGICIDRISSLITLACNGCLRLATSSEYRNGIHMDEKKLLQNIAEECCYKRCSMPYLRSLCCNT